MEGLKRLLCAGSLAGLAFLSGCNQPSKYVEGIVKKEKTNILEIAPSKGALFGNESVRITGDKNYVLQIETNEGLYTASVIPTSYGKKTLEALSEAIEEGTRVKFPTRVENRMMFGEDKIGTIYSDFLVVLGK